MAAKLKMKNLVVRNYSGEHLLHKGGRKAADGSCLWESRASASVVADVCYKS